MKLTNGGPYCSACFGAYHDRQHVDFEAYYDGPVIEGSVRVAIDDLVLCELCLENAANLLGFEAGAKAKIEKKNAEIKRLSEQLLKQERYALKLQEAFDSKPTRVKTAV